MTNQLITDKIASVNNTVIKSSCAHALVEALTELGVDSVFGYPGASVLSIYNELSYQKSIKHYLVRHEQAAVHAAEGYARTAGRSGTVLVTSGPGFTNTITGLANAYADSTPLVVLAGDVTSNNNSQKVFQKVDIPALTESCSKKTYQVSPKDDIKQVIKDAYETSQSGEKGPVVVILPRNILESPYIKKAQKSKPPKKELFPKETDFEKVISFLHYAKKPLIMLGGGASEASEDIKHFVDSLKIPVVSTLMGIGILPSDHDCYLGMAGINGNYAANNALNNADLILALGVSFSDRTTCKNKDFAPNSKIVNINLKSVSENFDLEMITDCGVFVRRMLTREAAVQDLTAWHEQIRLFRQESVPVQKSTSGLHSSSVLEAIYEYTKDLQPVVVTDVGQHQLLTAQFFNFSKPKKFITSGGLGTMGFGLPASVGVQIANPSALVLNITGDGSFQMNLQELATCREHHIPVKIIIMNNGYLGMVRQLQEKAYNNLYQVKMINPDFVKIAEAYDLFAVRVEKYEQLNPALESAIAHDGTAIIDIAIDSFEEI